MSGPRSPRLLALLCLMTALSTTQLSSAASPAAASQDYPVLDWLELLPANERNQGDQSLPPEHNFLNEAAGPALPQEMSFAINPELAGRKVKVPGFVVPLELDSAGRVLEFFLVPYFGACIHLPPPPPNQIIHVVLKTPFTLASLQTPYWLTGTLQTAEKMTRLGASAYSLAESTIEPYRR